MSTIQVIGGGLFDVMNPDSGAIEMDDIAHALGMICRFNGHTLRFYSVAEHCVHMSFQVPEEFALHALLHDAAEAYVSDLARPIKETLPDFEEIEAQVLESIYKALGLVYPDANAWRVIKEADLRMLATERAQLMTDTPHRWPCLDGVQPYEDLHIPGMEPRHARTIFKRRFYDLRAPMNTNFNAEGRV